MKVLVTGGTGFIGKYLVNELLENSYDVVVFTRRKNFEMDGVETKYGDITDYKSIYRACRNVDAVFHNAALARDWGKWGEFYRINVEGTKNVAEACIENGISHIIYTSSAGVYGFPNTEEWITEESQEKPLNAYHKSKLMGEKVLQGYDNIIASIIRPPLVLGAGGNATRIILSGIEKGRMVYVGDGNQHISIVHPSDVAQCLRLCLEKDEGGNIFNVVSFVCRIKELFEEIAREMGVEKVRKHIPYSIAYISAWISEKLSREPSITRFRVKSLGTTRRIDCQKAMNLLGYKPRYDLEKTVEEMVSWYRAKVRRDFITSST